MPLTLDTNIQYLKGVGEKRAQLYAKLGIVTVRQLLYHFPRDYIDLSKPYGVTDAPAFESCAVRAKLLRKSAEQRLREGLSVFKLLAEDDDGGKLEITMFNTKYIVGTLELDKEYIFFGKVTGGLSAREMSAPSIFPADSDNAILPVYPQTAGLTSALIRRNILQSLGDIAETADPLNREIREKYSFRGWVESMRDIHFPEKISQAGIARERFVFEELLALCCAFSILNSGNDGRTAETMKPYSLDGFWQKLPFKPTGAQLRAVEEAMADMCGGSPMNRLVQGDVGSGKTLVAAACIYFAKQNGYQSAIMAPTGILAEQHYATMSKLFSRLNLKAALLTGSTKASEKKQIRQGLLAGEIDLCVGTHALLSEGVGFAKLGFIVTDEQHRFGVAQRALLSEKNESAHVMVMSATPIPRTLSLIVYGDLKLSVLDEMPPGRQAVDTFVIGSAKRARAIGFIRKALDAGRQAYIVCPLIEAGESGTELRPAKEYASRLQKNELKGYSVSLLHGKMKSAEKEGIMRRFSCGEIQALVSTTVVEVGVDVPNATVILVENAERFGLSQLHQLRGRVGRGAEKSYCILVSDASGENARGRLNMMKQSSDGFKLAEYDLMSRGPGDFFGHRQHGLPALKVASLAGNMETMRAAQECAEEIISRDPALGGAEHAALGAIAREMLTVVGLSPN